MPFNQLILPLLGGYVFINHTYLTCYWASRHSKEHLLFLSAVSGAFLLLTARLMAGGLLMTDWGMSVAKTMHKGAPYDGIGTAFLAFLLVFVLRLWFNKTWTKVKAPLWLYAAGTFNQLENLLISSSYPVRPEARLQKHPWFSLVAGLFFIDGWYLGRARRRRMRQQDAVGAPEPTAEDNFSPRPIMLSMKNRKIYVGFVSFNLPMRAETKPFIVILPAWSGYRDKDTLRVIPSEDYESVIDQIDSASASDFTKIICLDDIESASLYDDDSFRCFSCTPDANDASTGGAQSPDPQRYVPLTGVRPSARSRTNSEPRKPRSQRQGADITDQQRP